MRFPNQFVQQDVTWYLKHAKYRHL
ncbi:LCI fold-containing protein [Proteiniclasticum sp.]